MVLWENLFLSDEPAVVEKLDGFSKEDLQTTGRPS
jgi:hypothetical protein